MKKYDPSSIEKKWQKKWDAEKLYETSTSDKPKFYKLVEFPYPSGNLHMGHWYSFAVPDIYARYKRMSGYNVLFPMGFDAFGLPAENAAIKNNLQPADWTKKNSAVMTKQMKSMGAIFDWSRMVSTIDPDYYRWTQWIFLQFYKAGLAYRAKTLVNWCPKDKTVLANEQVVDGKCDRCGSAVEQREREQWMYKITKYADQLLEGLDRVDWPEVTKTAQRNWIGKSEGAEVDFQLVNGNVKRFVLLHGRNGGSNLNFIPWLKKELERRGYEVIVPDMPNTQEPNDIEQAEYVKKHCILDEYTTLIGHSFGGVVAMRLLEQGVRVNQIIFVATPITGIWLDGGPERRASVTVALRKGFDFKIIRNNARSFTVLSDCTDTVVPRSDGKTLSENLHATLIEVNAIKPHFLCSEDQVILSACAPTIKVFTTRPDTLFGATYLVLAPEHVLVEKLKVQISNVKEVDEYVEKTKRKTPLQRQESKEKTGVELKGVYAINPANQEKILIWIADCVISSYGTGAIMAVPAHDERDFEFAKKYNLQIKKVIVPPALGVMVRSVGDIASGAKQILRVETECYQDEGELINSGKFSGMSSEQAKWEITNAVGGKRTATYRLRDWILSRQRYWGTPIPMISCEKCGYQPVGEDELPVKLPKLENYLPADDGSSPLARAEKWVKAKCPNCGGVAKRETDTMDTFVDSSWYFLRYTDPDNKKEFASGEQMKKWLPVDLYTGGAEHNTMHLLYSRFFIKALHELGYVDFDEPFTMRRNHGIVLGPDGQKMSKSKGNVIDPDKEVAQYGADTVRMFLAFLGPYDTFNGPWDPRAINGIYRFLSRVWVIAQNQNVQSLPAGRQVKNQNEQRLHQAIKKVGDDIEKLHFNTAISELMKLLNEFEKLQVTSYELQVFLRLLAPFAPHITEELWQSLRESAPSPRPSASIHLEPWPTYDPALIKEDTVTIAIQINGKTRATIQVPADSSEEAVAHAARAHAQVEKYLANQSIKKTIFVKNKLINFVI